MKGSMPMKRSSILRNTFFAQLIAFIISSLTQSIGSLIDGVEKYEIEFNYNGYEYEYDIDAKTGTILEKGKELIND